MSLQPCTASAHHMKQSAPSHEEICAAERKIKCRRIHLQFCTWLYLSFCVRMVGPVRDVCPHRARKPPLLACREQRILSYDTINTTTVVVHNSITVSSIIRVSHFLFCGAIGCGLCRRSGHTYSHRVIYILLYQTQRSIPIRRTFFFGEAFQYLCTHTSTATS